MKKPRAIHTAGLTAALIVIMVAPSAAQGLAPAARSTNAVAAAPVEHVDLLVGRSVILRNERPIKRVSLPKPDVADALVTSSHEVLVHGKTPGTISLLIWGDTGEVKTYDVSVQRDLSGLEERVRQLFPDEPIQVASNGADVVLSGVVSSKYVVEKAIALAGGYVEKADNVVNLLRQAEGMASDQVLLRVRFAEVSRSAMQELGASFFTSPTGVKNTVGRLTTQQFSAPNFEDLQWSKESSDFGAPVTSASGKFTFSDFLNLFLLSEKYDLGVVVRALSSKGLFQSLAEPNLVTQNGKEASFLAGGEYPYPVVQGGVGNTAISITFKEFGVRLRFTPTVVGTDLIHLKVAPEVSALDFSNAIILNGFRIPALSSRRTETEVELRDGQTFAIAGLMDNSLTSTMSKVPGIGDIPILGHLFRSRAYQKNATELVVMITPQILRRDSRGVASELPRLVQPYLGPEPKTQPPPPPAFTTPPPSAQADVPAAVPPAPPRPDRQAIEQARREEQQRLAEERQRAADEEKRAAEEQKRAREEEKRLKIEAEKQAREDQKRAREEEKRRLVEEKRAAEEAKRQRAIEEKQAREAAAQAAKEAEEQRRLAEEQRKREAEEAERLAREQKKLDEEQQKLESQLKKLEEQRAEAERRRLEERKKAQQQDAQKRLLAGPWPELRSRRPW